MSDTTTTTETPETEIPDPQPSTETVTDWKAEAEKWKALSRKNEDTAKANADAAKELAAIKDADKSELQRISDERDAARDDALRNGSDRLRYEVALDMGLTKRQALRLVGSTREELEADAAALLDEIKDTKPAPAPSPDGQGKQGEPIGGVKQLSESDLDSMTADQIVKARKEGRLDQLMGVKK